MILAVIIPLLLAFATPFLSHVIKKYWNVAILGSFISFCLILKEVPVFMARSMVYIIWKAPPYGIILHVDSFNGLVALLISLVFTLVAIYSVIYMKGRKGLEKFYALYLLMLVGILGVVLTGDLFNMFVFFEIASISAYALVTYLHTKKSLLSATRFLILGSLGTSLFLLGITFMYALTGTLNIADMVLKSQSLVSPLLPAALALFFVGVGIKSAVVPFHLWKPGAVGDAPLPVSALLATASTTMGLYAMSRILFTVFFNFHAVFSQLLLAFGALTMTVGALMALMEPNIKKLLAYSGISQVGYVLLAFGLATYPGVFAGLFHIFNFVIAKALLFLVVGMLIIKTRETDLNRLRGLGAHLPGTALAFLIGALATAGLPGFSGFVSKWFIYMAAIEAGYPFLAALAIIVSAITLAYYLRAFATIFLGPSEKMKFNWDPHYLIPILILAGTCMLVGVFPYLFTGILESASVSLADVSKYVGVLA